MCLVGWKSKKIEVGEKMKDKLKFSLVWWSRKVKGENER